MQTKLKENIKGRKTYLAALLPFILLVGMFELLPIAITIVRSFLKEGGELGVTLENYINIFTKPLYRSAITNSLLISVVSAVIGLIVAFIGSKAAHEKNGR